MSDNSSLPSPPRIRERQLVELPEKIHNLPSAASAPGAGFRLAVRLPTFVVHLVIGVLIAGWLQLDSKLGRHFKAFSERLILWWIRRIIRVLHVRLTISGTAPEQPSLLVSNHVTWLDALLVGGYLRCRFLVKYEVGTWPVIGALLKSAGSTFLARGAHQTAEVANNLSGFLSEGQHALMYPEATTTWGDEISYFFPRLFKAAIDTNTPVQPLSVNWKNLKYRGETWRNAAPYTDDINFVENVGDILKSPYTEVELRYLEPIISAGQSRDDLAAKTRMAISNELGFTATAKQKNDVNFKRLISRLRRVPGSWKSHYD